MKRFIRIVAIAIVAPLSMVFALSTAAVAGTSTPALANHPMSASAAIAAAQLSTAQEAANAVPASPVGCNSGFFCVYDQVSPGICTFDCPQPCDQTAANVKHDYTSCANKQESLDNNLTSGKARLFYGAGESGPWMCTDAGQAIDDLSTGDSHNGGGPYLFDQGPNKNAYEVWHDAHSVQTLSSGNCNPDE